MSNNAMLFAYLDIEFKYKDNVLIIEEFDL